MIKRLVLLAVLIAALPAWAFGATSITQYTITWTFDGDYTTGQFANGDYWVLGPVGITGITNTRHPSKGATDGYDGSQINPVPGGSQGFDSRLPSYSASANVFLSLPITLQPGESLVSMTSVLNSEGTINPELGTPKPALQSGAVLTCLALAPPSGSLRPPYVGTTKTLYNTSDIQMSKLPSLSAPASTPSITTIEDAIRRPQLDHIVGWAGTYFHPVDNYPPPSEHYGHNISGAYGTAALMLLLDDADVGDKSDLAMHFVQMSIDLYHILDNGGYWLSDGGHGQGRKLPILMTGWLIDDADMLAIGDLPLLVPGGGGHNYFQEDGSTFYVEETSPGVYNNGYGGYDASHVGLAEWGAKHTYQPDRDDASYTASYRWLNRYTHSALVALALGLDDEWNRQVMFDYTERWANIIGPSAYPSYIHFSTFTGDMWDTYRSGVPYVVEAPPASSDLIISGENGTSYSNANYFRLVITNSSNITINNCTFTASSGHVSEISNSSNITISNSDFDGQAVDGGPTGACTGVHIGDGTNVYLTNNVYHDISDDGIEVHDGNGIYVTGCTIRRLIAVGTDGNGGSGPCYNGHSDGMELSGITTGVFDGNLIYDVRSTSAIFFGNWGPTNSDMTFKNNLFYTPEAGFSAYFNYVDGLEVYNNVFWQGVYGGVAVNANTVTNMVARNNIVHSWNFNHHGYSQNSEQDIDYSVIGVSGSGYTPNTNDVVDSDPDFSGIPAIGGAADRTVDASDFELQLGSSAIDAGTAGVGVPPTDYYGNSRDASPDIGAIEFGAVLGSDTTDPTVSITTTAYGLGAYTEESTIALTGSASDNIALSSISWSNSLGGSGSCAGTSTWSCTATLSETTLGSELVTNGTFDSGYTGWSANNSILSQGTFNGRAGSLSVADNGEWSEAYQTATVESGEYYLLSGSYYTDVSNWWNGRIMYDWSASRTDTEGDGVLSPNVEDQWSQYNYVIQSTDTSLTIRAFSNSVNTAYFDDVSLKKATDVNVITVTATDTSSNTDTDTYYVVYQFAPPPVPTDPIVTVGAIDNSTVDITTSESTIWTGYDNGDCCITPEGGGSCYDLESPTGSGTSWSLTSVTPAVAGTTYTLSCTLGTDDIEDDAGNDMVTFSAFSIDNDTSSGSGVTVQYRIGAPSGEYNPTNGLSLQ